MRITFVLPDVNLGGGTRVLAIYADRLTRRGHKVVVVGTPMPRPTLSLRARWLLKGHGWPRYQRCTASHFDGVEGVDLRLVDRRRPITDADVPDADVVIATWWETAEWVANLSDRKGSKAYFVQHYEAFPHLPAKRVEATWRLPLH